MFPFDARLSWMVGSLWYAVLVVAAFALSWLVTDIGHVGRRRYIGVLAIGTAALSTTYVSWTRAGRGFWSWHWIAGVLGGVVAGGVLVWRARTILRSRHAEGFGLIGLFVWESVVYGTAEGLLLSVLPAAMAWQSLRSLGWTDGTVGSVVGMAVALTASVALIVVHHLGYWEFRGPLMRFPVIWCAILTAAYLVTGSPIAPVVGHIALHAAMTLRGMELPPHSRVSTVASHELSGLDATLRT